MKHYFTILILIILTSCVTNKNVVTTVNHLNPRNDGANFIDSLRRFNIDTIIGYYDGCSGCIAGFPKPYYVFWADKGNYFITKFTEETSYNHINDWGFSIPYVSSILDTLKSEKLVVPEIMTFHYGYENIIIILDSTELTYQVKDYERPINENSYKVILIDKFRSSLFNINYWDWKGLDYKIEKMPNRM